MLDKRAKRVYNTKHRGKDVSKANAFDVLVSFFAAQSCGRYILDGAATSAARIASPAADKLFTLSGGNKNEYGTRIIRKQGL